MKQDIFRETESSYLKFQRALEIEEKAYQSLEKKRSYFWKVMGNPPIIRKIQNIMHYEYLPAFILVACIPIAFLVSTFLANTAIVLLFSGLVYVTFSIGLKHRDISKVRHDERTRFREKQLGLRPMRNKKYRSKQ